MNQHRPNTPTLLWLALLLLTIPFSGCIKQLTVKNVVYDNTFSSGELLDLQVSGWDNGSFGILSTPRISTFNGQKVLGKLNNNIVRLVLNDLPKHDILRVEVELNLHNNWRNDLWKMEFDGETRLLTGFSNDPTVKQSYPNWLGNGTTLGVAGTNARLTGMPGICSTPASQLGSSAYTIVQTFGHTSNNFTLQLSDAGGNVNDTCNRSWSVARLTLSVFHN
ncbi:MAG: hypothetical protein ACK5B4_10645 [Bacteroidota bacterium]|jgi:hypothetical protein